MRANADSLELLWSPESIGFLKMINILSFKLFTSTSPFKTDTDSHVGLELKASTIQLKYCQGACEQMLTRQFDLSVSVSNDQIIFGKLHESLYKYAEEDLERYPAFNSLVTSLEIDGQTRNLWSGATLLR